MQQTTNKKFKGDGDVAQCDQNIYEVAFIFGSDSFSKFSSKSFHWSNDQKSICWKSVWVYLKTQIEFWTLNMWYKFERLFSRLEIYLKHGP